MADWLEHSVQVEVEAPIAYVWSLWSNLEQMPQWMQWIDSVTVLQDDPELSRWKLASGGLEFTWLSRLTNQVPHQIIQWQSVDGLPNQGAIRFYDRHGSTIVKLTIAYRIPGFLGALMDSLFVGKLVESRLQADLAEFRRFALQNQAPASTSS